MPDPKASALIAESEEAQMLPEPCMNYLNEFFDGELSDREKKDTIRTNMLNDAVKYLKSNQKYEDFKKLNILLRLYEMDLNEYDQAGLIKATSSHLIKLQKAAANLQNLLITLGSAGNIANHYIEHSKIPGHYIQLHIAGPILNPVLWPNYPEYGKSTLIERVGAFAHVAGNALCELRTSGGCKGGRRNAHDLAHGSPLLYSMGEIAIFLNGRQKSILTLARKLHEAATHRPPLEAGWGEDEAARAGKWWDQLAPWMGKPREDWPSTISNLYNKGPVVIPSKKQDRNAKSKKRRSTAKD